MKRFLVVLLLVFSLAANAGYAVNVTASNFSNFAVRGYTACYLTVGMAIGSIYSGSNYIINSIDTTSNTWSVLGSPTTAYASGSFTTCTASASGGYQPPTSGVVTDPGLISGGISTGGGSGGSGSATLGDIEFNADAFDAAFQGGVMLFITGVGIGLIVNLVRRLRTP